MEVQHVLEIFERLGVETRTAASLRAIEVLISRREPGRPQGAEDSTI